MFQEHRRTLIPILMLKSSFAFDSCILATQRRPCYSALCVFTSVSPLWESGMHRVVRWGYSWILVAKTKAKRKKNLAFFYSSSRHSMVQIDRHEVSMIHEQEQRCYWLRDWLTEAEHYDGDILSHLPPNLSRSFVMKSHFIPLLVL